MSIAHVTRRVRLEGRWGVVAMNRRGTVLARSEGQLAVVRADGSSRVWPTDGRVLSCALSDADRVAALVTYPSPSERWPAWIRIVSADASTEVRLDANVTGSLGFQHGTDGAIAWADDGSLWLAGSDDTSGDLWIGRVDLDPWAVCGCAFLGPRAEPQIVFAPGATRARCSFELDAQQDGGWAYVATIDAKAQVAQLVPGDWVTSHLETEDGGVVALDGGTLVRWSADRTTRHELQLDEGRFPVLVIPASGDRAVIELDGAGPLVRRRRPSSSGRYRRDRTRDRTRPGEPKRDHHATFGVMIALTELRVAGYRSLRDIRVPLRAAARSASGFVARRSSELTRRVGAEAGV